MEFNKLIDKLSSFAGSIYMLFAPFILFAYTYLGFFGLSQNLGMKESVGFFLKCLSEEGIIASFVSLVLICFSYKCRRKIILMIFRGEIQEIKWPREQRKTARVRLKKRMSYLKKGVDFTLPLSMLFLILWVGHDRTLKFIEYGTHFLILLTLVGMLPAVALLILIPDKELNDSPKAIRKHIINSLAVLGLYSLIVIFVSQQMIKDYMKFPIREDGLLRVWIDEKNEYLLSCALGTQGVMFIRESILNTGDKKKQEIFENDDRVEFTNISISSAKSICDRMFPKQAMHIQNKK